MNILSYYNVIVKYKALFPYYIYKAIFFFDFLRIAHYIVKLKKGSSPIQGRIFTSYNFIYSSFIFVWNWLHGFI